MPDSPNLDYEPGPNAASFSRLGPLPAPGAMGPVSAAPLLGTPNFELAEEVGIPGGMAAGANRRRAAVRRSRRRHKYQ